jgi:hypothetical protein
LTPYQGDVDIGPPSSDPAVTEQSPQLPSLVAWGVNAIYQLQFDLILLIEA